MEYQLFKKNLNICCNRSNGPLCPGPSELFLFVLLESLQPGKGLSGKTAGYIEAADPHSLRLPFHTGIIFFHGIGLVFQKFIIFRRSKNGSGIRRQVTQVVKIPVAAFLRLFLAHSGKIHIIHIISGNPVIGFGKGQKDIKHRDYGDAIPEKPESGFKYGDNDTSQHQRGSRQGPQDKDPQKGQLTGSDIEKHPVSTGRHHNIGAKGYQSKYPLQHLAFSEKAQAHQYDDKVDYTYRQKLEKTLPGIRGIGISVRQLQLSQEQINHLYPGKYQIHYRKYRGEGNCKHRLLVPVLPVILLYNPAVEHSHKTIGSKKTKGEHTENKQNVPYIDMPEKTYEQIPEYRIRAHQKGQDEEAQRNRHENPQGNITSLAILFPFLRPFLPPGGSIAERTSQTGYRLQNTLTDSEQKPGKIPCPVIQVLMKHQTQREKENPCFCYQLYADIVCKEHGYSQEKHAHNGEGTVFFQWNP